MKFENHSQFNTMPEIFEKEKQKEAEAVRSLESFPFREMYSLGNKIDLLLVYSGLKPATDINIGKDWEKGQHPLNLSEEEIASVREKLGGAGLISVNLPKESGEIKEISEEKTEPSAAYYYEESHFFVAKDKNAAEALKNAYEKNDAVFGRLSGFPESAIKAYSEAEKNPNALIEIEELPEEIRAQDFMAFATFKLSRENWRDEIETVKKWADAIKKLDPALYEEAVKIYNEVHPITSRLEKTNLKIESKEISGERFLEYSRKIGDFYVSVVENLIKAGERKEEFLKELPSEIKNEFKDFIETIDKNNQLQRNRFSLKEGGARDLLLELAEGKSLNKELLNDQTKYELEEISPGIFVIFMDKDLYSNFHGENVAVATLVKNGVSFISMPKEYREEKFRKLYEENLLHETHHLIWSSLLNERKINIQEPDDDKWTAYRFFQDEVIARLCSGGGMIGYSHLLMMDKKTLEEFRATNPQKEEEINKSVANLNNMMYDEIMPLMNEAGVEKRDLIFTIMKSRNFAEAESILKKFKAAIEQKAEESKKIKPKIESGGWDITN